MTTTPLNPEPTDPAPKEPAPPQKLPRLYPVRTMVLIGAAGMLLIMGFIAVAIVTGFRATPFIPFVKVIAFQAIPTIGIVKYRMRQRVRCAHRAGRAFDPTDVATLFRTPPTVINVAAGPTDAPDGLTVHREFVVVRAVVIALECLILILLIHDLESYRAAGLFPDSFPQFLRSTGPNAPTAFYAILGMSLAVGSFAVGLHASYVLKRTKLGPNDCRSCGYHVMNSAAMPKCPECGEPIAPTVPHA